MPTLRLGDIAPNFTQESSEGPIDFYQWAGDSWVVLFSHPADFTPVCTTELGKTAALSGEFATIRDEECGLVLFTFHVSPVVDFSTCWWISTTPMYVTCP